MQQLDDGWEGHTQWSERWRVQALLCTLMEGGPADGQGATPCGSGPLSSNNPAISCTLPSASRSGLFVLLKYRDLFLEGWRRGTSWLYGVASQISTLHSSRVWSTLTSKLHVYITHSTCIGTSVPIHRYEPLTTHFLAYPLIYKVQKEKQKLYTTMLV